MATATSKWALPYPVASDPADVPTDMGALAARIEAVGPYNWATTNGVLAVPLAVTVRSDASQVGIGALNTIYGGGPSAGGIAFGSTYDTNLYRVAAGQLKTDGQFFAVGGGQMGWTGSTWALTIQTNGNVGVSGQLSAGSISDGTLPARLRAAPSTIFPGNDLNATGETGWYYYDASSTPNRPANQYGYVLNFIWSGTLSQRQIAIEHGTNNIYARNGTGAWNRLVQADINGTLDLGRVRFPYNGAGGDIVFGGDTYLYRSAAGVLTITNVLKVNNDVQVDMANAGSRVIFGSAGDTYLYRSAANQLKTDGDFYATNVYTGATRLQNNGISIAGDVSLYRVGAGIWQTDQKWVFSSGNYIYIGAYSSDTAVLEKATTNTLGVVWNHAASWAPVWASAFTVQSDRSTKRDISKVEIDHKKLLSAGIYRYKRDHTDEEHLGLMSDELPDEVVEFGGRLHGGKGEPEYGIDLYKLITALLATVQHLDQRLQALEA